MLQALQWLLGKLGGLLGPAFPRSEASLVEVSSPLALSGSVYGGCYGEGEVGQGEGTL